VVVAEDESGEDVAEEVGGIMSIEGVQ